MTRRDSDVSVNDAEGDRGGSSSRPSASSPSSSSSPNEAAWRDKEARKSSGSLEGDSKLSPSRQIVGAGNNEDGKVEGEGKGEGEKFHRVMGRAIEGESVEANQVSRQPFRRKMDVCLGHVIETTGVCGSSSSTTTATTAAHLPSTPIFSSTSGSSTSPGETRLTASILFDLPEPRASSAADPADKMPAITKAQMKEFEDAFNLFDKDRDGSITKEELGRVMRGLGQFARMEELRTMLEEIDTDGDGNVSLVEFVKIVSNIGSASSAAAPTDLSQEEQEEQELRDAFRVFDKHNRGYITASDLRAVLQCLGEDLSEEEIEDMIKEVDEDGDGRIDFYEFARSLVEPGTDDEDEEEDDEEIPQSPF
ncbi:probable calcium-binding protein CML22 [Venturia canescens]|uniref:probable calcium-binding protein CML22 n=1 Tax=Venturia canescens TaxID=32260 RepID=UPI001C9BD63D|nr:probable calcium-binding protein CML22 [Venturia canescens]XP_043266505.1 probable calcium-binding protein CML22 [Venturia canescens]XP_043266506.1 probable calcium-binding protein CML22 [Venturia canescens]